MAHKLRAGVIGTGMIGKHHLNQYRNIPEVEVVAVADVRKEEAERVAAEHGIQRVFTDYRKLLAMDEIDIVDVCLPNALHCPITVAALKAGKHVYCEKPMANNGAESRKMVATAQATGKKLAIQLSTLFSKEAKAAQRMIEAGVLGRVYHAKSSNYRRRGRCYVDGYATPVFVQKEHAGGGAMADMGVYHLSLMLWLLGNPEVETVSGQTYQEIAMDEKRRKESKYDVEETAVAFVRFAGNVTLMFEESWAMHLDRAEGQIVFGSEGGIRLQPFGLFRDVASMESNAAFDLDAYEGRQRLLRSDYEAYTHPQTHFVWAVLGRVPLIDSAGIACKTAEITEAIYKSSDKRGEVASRGK
jgi:predicted dehydrogenase